MRDGHGGVLSRLRANQHVRQRVRPRQALSKNVASATYNCALRMPLLSSGRDHPRKHRAWRL
ncbi:hypothetical protein NXC24_PB00500 (plasmid) [Rhizobium sp. NXC24]|nr:hypothetical protein NXC24_PB00500 [Rhizobium sp. NXC24]